MINTKHYRFYIIVFLFLGGLKGLSQVSLDSMIAVLQQNDFDKIYLVKDSIVSSQEKAIPKLIELLKDTTYLKLDNTMDLIYPGADHFYGHGWIVDYDLDWVSVRAAWLLEEITFQDFGYKNITIHEDSLIKLHEEKYYSEYLKIGYHNVNFRNKTPRQQLIIYHQLLAESVAKWWAMNKNTWTRFNALKLALISNNLNRLSLALEFLRFDKTACDNLTLTTYKSEITPLVRKVRHSKSEEAEQAKLLMQDHEYYWLKIKPSRRKH
jgi:hypothetical protein